MSRKPNGAHAMFAADLRSLEGLIRILTSQVGVAIDESSRCLASRTSDRTERMATVRVDIFDTAKEVGAGCVATLENHQMVGTRLRYLLLLDRTAGNLRAIGTTAGTLTELRPLNTEEQKDLEDALFSLRRLSHGLKTLVRRSVDAILSHNPVSEERSRLPVAELRETIRSLIGDAQEIASKKTYAASSRILAWSQLLERCCELAGTLSADARDLLELPVENLAFKQAKGGPRPTAEDQAALGVAR